jgi:hypothetical protein
MDWDGQHTGADHRPGIMFGLGDVHQRSAVGPETVIGTAAGFSTACNLSLDGALFPFLHPGCVGTFRTGESLSVLLRQHIQQLFFPFTMVKEYLLVMFQVGKIALCSCCLMLWYCCQHVSPLQRSKCTAFGQYSTTL